MAPETQKFWRSQLHRECKKIAERNFLSKKTNAVHSLILISEFLQNAFLRTENGT